MKKMMIERCYHTPEHIFTMDNVDYYAADQQGVVEFNGDVIINLSSTPNIPHAIPDELREHYDIPCEEIMVPWPDFGKPKVKMSFWETIHKVIKHRGWKTVCIHCGHGHGRTGTAMSCILVAMCGYSATEAVDTIRKYHCEEAVETSGQCRYIMEVDYQYNGRKLSEENSPLPSMRINWKDSDSEDDDEEESKDKIDTVG
jgi:hypothetical protein